MKNYSSWLKIVISLLVLVGGMQHVCSEEVKDSDPFALEQHSGKDEKKEELGIMGFSKTGANALRHFQNAIVASYKDGPVALYGFSGNFNGEIIDNYETLNKNESKRLQEFLLDDKNLERNYKLPDIDNLDWEQGVEFTDGSAFIRIYFTGDGQWCNFLASSGEVSGMWKCSQKLKGYASLLLNKLNNKK